MAGYLDEYGVQDARRERRTKLIAGTVLVAAIVGVTGFFLFRNWSEERVIDRFLTLLKEKKYQDAYALWGCTPSTPCKSYDPERFTQDWGPSGTYKDPEKLKREDEDSCGDGVVFGFSYPGTENFGLWVDRGTKIISFAPWPRCPGPHLALGKFFREHFGSGSK